MEKEKKNKLTSYSAPDCVVVDIQMKGLVLIGSPVNPLNNSNEAFGNGDVFNGWDI